MVFLPVFAFLLPRGAVGSRSERDHNVKYFHLRRFSVARYKVGMGLTGEARPTLPDPSFRACMETQNISCELSFPRTLPGKTLNYVRILNSRTGQDLPLALSDLERSGNSRLLSRGPSSRSSHFRDTGISRRTAVPRYCEEAFYLFKAHGVPGRQLDRSEPLRRV